DPQKVLRTALGRAGLIEGWEHVCRRCKAKGRTESEHTTAHPDDQIRACQHCGMWLWPKVLPRPMRFHDLRHTTATLLLRAGVPAHQVQRILRHASITTTTGIYGHLVVEDLREAVAKLPNAPEPESGDLEAALAAVGANSNPPVSTREVPGWAPEFSEGIAEG